MDNRIVVVGSLNMDLVVRMPQIPRVGETLLGGVFKTFPGGKGANQAVAAARLGANVTMIGCVGNDAFGKEMLETLKKEGIDTSYIQVHEEAATGVALIQVDANGQNTISVASGANFQLTVATVKETLLSIGKFDALVMPLEIPLDTVFTAAEIASQQGTKVLLNPAPAQVLKQNLLELVDVLLPNEYELALMTGNPSLKSMAEVQAVAEKMLAHGPRNLLVTMGNKGAMLFNGKLATQILPYPVEAVDTTAAGDCFVGALAVGLCEGKSMIAAAEFASAAAAISVTRNGAQPSLPSRQEVLQFMMRRNESQ
jgi:ribokinase